jgi:hypothetical protein
MATMTRDVGLEDSGSLDLYVDRANAAMRELISNILKGKNKKKEKAE